MPGAEDGRGGVDATLVRRLIATQVPQWQDLPVRQVEVDGWDNRTYRLGDDMLVRLPSGEGYALQVEKEHRWLPALAPWLPLPIPVPLAKGTPAEGYPYNWSVYRWLDGDTASLERIEDQKRFAVTLADFLTTLQGIDASDGPPPGRHSQNRGLSPSVWDEWTRESIAKLDGRIDTRRATEVWEAATAATWRGSPVWFHGDVAVGNLLVCDGELAAVIDFGCSGVGDPACDLVIAWTFFEGETREVFRTAMNTDPGTWTRGRGWALWKELIQLVDKADDDPGAAAHHRVIDAVLADHERGA